MKYLIYFDATLGNFTHLIPNLLYLKNKKVNYTILVINSDVYELSKYFGITKKVIFFKKKKNLLLNCLSILKLIYSLNKKNFDVLINLSLHSQWKNIMFNKLVRIKTKFSFLLDQINQNISDLNYFFYNKKKSEAQNYTNFFQYIFREKFNTKFPKNKKIKKNIIGIHTGSSKSLSYKRWDKFKFSLLIKKLIKKNYFIILFGKGSEETEINKIIFNEIKSNNLFNYTNKLNLKKLIFYLQNCKLILSNDSGIMQLSGLFNVPTVGLFGPTSELKNSPNNKKFYPIRLFSKEYCNKYTNQLCEKCSLNKKYKLQPKCLESIDINFVYKKILRHLN